MHGKYPGKIDAQSPFAGNSHNSISSQRLRHIPYMYINVISSIFLSICFFVSHLLLDFGILSDCQLRRPAKPACKAFETSPKHKTLTFRVYQSLVKSHTDFYDSDLLESMFARSPVAERLNSIKIHVMFSSLIPGNYCSHGIPIGHRRQNRSFGVDIPFRNLGADNGFFSFPLGTIGYFPTCRSPTIFSGDGITYFAVGQFTLCPRRYLLCNHFFPMKLVG